MRSLICPYCFERYPARQVAFRCINPNATRCTPEEDRALGDYQRLARSLRAAGLGADVFPEPKKVGQQLQYAERRGFKVALIAGPDEFAQKVWKVKNLARREETTVGEDNVIATVQAILSAKI